MSTRPIDGKYEAASNILNAVVVRNKHTMEELPLDEPLFVLRGRDLISIAMLIRYRDLCRVEKCSEAQIQGVEEAIERFRQFRDNHEDRMRLPSMTHEQTMKGKTGTARL